MFSSMTSRIDGLMGRKTTEEGAEDPSQPKDDEDTPNKSRSGSTGAATTVDGPSVLSSVRNQLPSWLGGGKKDEETPTDPVIVTPDKGSDGSSDTGGADSEKERELQAAVAAAEGAGVTDATPNLDKVKTLGNFLFTTIKGAGQKIKDTPNLLTEFHKEHELFMSKAGRGGKDAAVAPWVGHAKEEALKEEILSLSTDRRNFVRSPPTGVSFAWDFEEMLPVAKAILKDDPNLEKMRYELVPKVISEEHFWRNYFYRVTLLKESMQETNCKKQDSIETDEEDAELEKELNEELKSFEVVSSKEETELDLK